VDRGNRNNGGVGGNGGIAAGGAAASGEHDTNANDHSGGDITVLVKTTKERAADEIRPKYRSIQFSTKSSNRC
jgi:hypothetical protein